MTGRRRPKHKSSSPPTTIPKLQIFLCNLCRNPFRSRELFNSHCKETHNINLTNSPEDEDQEELDEASVDKQVSEASTSKHRKVRVSGQTASNSSRSITSSVEDRIVQNAHVRVVDISPALRSTTPSAPSESGSGSSSSLVQRSNDVAEPSLTCKKNKRDKSQGKSVEQFDQVASDEGRESKDEEETSKHLVSEGGEEQGCSIIEDGQSDQAFGPSCWNRKTKGYSCPVPGCSNTFIRKYKYENHLLIHEGFKPFVCPYCEYGYDDDIKLIEHVTMRHTKESAFQCPECTRSYKTKRCLDAHLGRCHHMQ